MKAISNRMGPDLGSGNGRSGGVSSRLPARALFWSFVPQLLSVWILALTANNRVQAVNSFLAALAIATGQFLLMHRSGISGIKSVAALILGISSLGSLGMAIGSLLDHEPRACCCLAVFDWGAFFSRPNMLMLLFCGAGHWLLGGRHIRREETCLFLLAMYTGMCLAGRYLAAAVVPVFGAVGAMHWAMFAGMVAGHLAGYLAMGLFHRRILIKTGIRLISPGRPETKTSISTLSS